MRAIIQRCKTDVSNGRLKKPKTYLVSRRLTPRLSRVKMDLMARIMNSRVTKFPPFISVHCAFRRVSE